MDNITQANCRNAITQALAGGQAVTRTLDPSWPAEKVRAELAIAEEFLKKSLASVQAAIAAIASTQSRS